MDLYPPPLRPKKASGTTAGPQTPKTPVTSILDLYLDDQEKENGRTVKRPGRTDQLHAMEKTMAQRRQERKSRYERGYARQQQCVSSVEDGKVHGSSKVGSQSTEFNSSLSPLEEKEEEEEEEEKYVYSPSIYSRNPDSPAIQRDHAAVANRLSNSESDGHGHRRRYGRVSLPSTFLAAPELPACDVDSNLGKHKERDGNRSSTEQASAQLVTYIRDRKMRPENYKKVTGVAWNTWL